MNVHDAKRTATQKKKGSCDALKKQVVGKKLEKKKKVGEGGRSRQPHAEAGRID